MAFEPKFSVCIIENCSKLVITDTRGMFTGSNQGWDVNIDPNTNKASVNLATIQYKLPGDTVFTVINVTALIANTIGSYTDFILATIEDISDGQIEIIYTIVTTLEGQTPITYIKKVTMFNVCSVQCCVDKLWLKTLEDCNCGCDSNIKKAYEAQSILTGIQNSGECGSLETKNKLLTKLQRICKQEKCNCNH